ncbi:MAG: hypothetical protein ABI083_01990 [Lapillicoccus sp.]
MPQRHSGSGLPWRYRLSYRLQMIGLSVFGPAQLGETNDPKLRLERERAERISRLPAKH